MATITKSTHGGARNFADPKKGKVIRSNVTLYKKQKEYLVKKYGGLTKALKSLLPDNLKDSK